MELDTALFAHGSDQSIVSEVGRWLLDDPSEAEADFITESISVRLANAYADVAFWLAFAAVAITWAGICFAIGFTDEAHELRGIMLIFAGGSALIGAGAMYMTLRSTRRASAWVELTAKVAAVRLAAKQRPWWKRLLG